MTNPDHLDVIADWWASLPRFQGGLPAKGSIAGALVLMERLKNEFRLDLDSHRTPGKSQIQGVSGRAVRDLLQRFDETRSFLVEGGRTNRGLTRDLASLLDSLQLLELENLPLSERNQILDSLQAYLATRVTEYFSLQRLKVIYDPTRTLWDAVHILLEEADAAQKKGPVAEYLVGAKLELRFPDLAIINKRSSSSDQSTGHHGDFFLGDTAFHVTVHPTPNHYLRCQQNLDKGLRPYLIVPDSLLAGARQNAEVQAVGKITVQSIESFISQNIDELSSFSAEEAAREFLSLLQTYNRRVALVESDPSYLVEIPPNLERFST